MKRHTILLKKAASALLIVSLTAGLCACKENTPKSAENDDALADGEVFYVAQGNSAETDTETYTETVTSDSSGSFEMSIAGFFGRKLRLQAYGTQSETIHKRLRY